MLNKMKTFIAVAVLSGTVSANVHAATIKVEKGDTLWDLSKVHNTSVENLQNLNHLSTDIIHPGDVLKISTAKPVKTKKSTTSIPSPIPDKKKSVKLKLAKKESVKAAKPAPAKKQVKKVITVKATAYTASCEGCSGITKMGINIKANPHKKVIAVDPSVIPLGSKVYVEGYGKAIAGDIGGAIKGKRIDIFIPSKRAAVRYGVKKIKVTILD